MYSLKNFLFANETISLNVICEYCIGFFKTKFRAQGFYS